MSDFFPYQQGVN